MVEKAKKLNRELFMTKCMILAREVKHVWDYQMRKNVGWNFLPCSFCLKSREKQKSERG